MDKMDKMLPKLLNLNFFSVNKVCGSDFERGDQKVLINPKFIVAISELSEFRLPLSGDPINQSYATVEMANDIIYYIREKEYNKLVENKEQ